MKATAVAARLGAMAVVVSLGAGATPHAPTKPLLSQEQAEVSITAEELQGYVEHLASDQFEGREAGTPGGHAAGDYLQTELSRLGIAGASDAGRWEQPFDDAYRNILGLVEGSDPAMKDEFILIGAHYDHVGYGNKENSRGPLGQIHYGADDNASGTAVLLELAEALRTMPRPPARSILLAFWDGEEKEMLGSRHWAAHPTVPLDRVKAAINVDMVGRLRNERLTLYGSRTALGFRRLVSQDNRLADLRIDYSWELEDDSDHGPFFLHDIPVLFFYTGDHRDSHSPRDTAQQINSAGMARIGRLLFRVVNDLAERPAGPQFRHEALTETEKTRLVAYRPQARPEVQQAVYVADKRPRLGISWRTDDAEPGTIVLTQVVPGSPAADAGLAVGDRIYHDLPDDTAFARLVASQGREPMRLVVEREGRVREVIVTLQPVESQGPHP
jgi:hypothetical protein